MLYAVIRVVSALFFRHYLFLQVNGAHHIPARGGCVIAANHASYLDPLLLVVASRRPLCFIARDKVLASRTIGWIARYARTIPVKRHGDMSALKRALAVLREGRVLAIFPEGTRSKTKQLKQAKPGVGFLIAKAKVPVVPVCIEGSFDAQPRGLRTLRRHPVRVTIGKPLDAATFPALVRGSAGYQSLSDAVMRAIAGLKGSGA